jgi:hypothetical protein
VASRGDGRGLVRRRARAGAERGHRDGGRQPSSDTARRAGAGPDPQRLRGEPGRRDHGPNDHLDAQGPEAAGEGTPTWKLENAAITAADLTFGSLTFTAQTLVRLVTISAELYEDSDPSAGGIVAYSFAAQMAVELDRPRARSPRGDTSGTRRWSHDRPLYVLPLPNPVICALLSGLSRPARRQLAALSTLVVLGDRDDGGRSP